MAAGDRAGEHEVSGSARYFGAAPGKPAFHAKDHRRDNWQPDVRPVTFRDARGRATPPSLWREGLMLAEHRTRVRDFTGPYVSDMRPGEALVFRAYGNEPGRLPGAPHVAFTDPGCPAGAGPRVSVEARAYAVFDSWPPDGAPRKGGAR